MRLGRRHNMPPPHLDFWPFNLEVGVGVACDLGYPCAKFRLPMPFGFRVRADVRDIRQTDGRTDDGRRWPINAPAPPPLRGGGIINIILGTRDIACASVMWQQQVQHQPPVQWKPEKSSHFIFRDFNTFKAILVISVNEKSVKFVSFFNYLLIFLRSVPNIIQINRSFYRRTPTNFFYFN